MSRRVFVEQLTEAQAEDGLSPTVVRIEGKGREQKLRLPADEYLHRAEAIRLAKWILRHFRKP